MASLRDIFRKKRYCPRGNFSHIIPFFSEDVPKWDWIGLDGLGWDICVGLFYEHRFAVLISGTNYLIENEASYHNRRNQEWREKEFDMDYITSCSFSFPGLVTLSSSPIRVSVSFL